MSGATSDPARRDYAVVTAAYWGFTLSDGALRMLVLLHLHRLGYSPLQIASMFLAYELCGVLTNLFGGWLAARSGLRLTLVLGLGLQLLTCGVLMWRAEALGLGLVLGAQAASGVAKDLTKMSAKSFVKLLIPEGETRGLLRWVAVLTGSKNALKGLGFFLGGALLSLLGFAGALAVLAGLLFLALVGVLGLLPAAAGRSRAGRGWRQLFAHAPQVQWLSLARFFLFGARDVWFVLALPIYLSASLGWSFAGTGGFLAAWVIGYGMVQAAAPRYLGAQPGPRRLLPLSLGLLLSLGVLLGGLAVVEPQDQALVLVLGLALFGLVFAANSALHSYLIIAYAGRDQVSLKVGFYYMANAAGRLLGTLLSGWLFQAAGEGQPGLEACLGASAVLVLAALLASLPLGRLPEPGAGSAVAEI